MREEEEKGWDEEGEREDEERSEQQQRAEEIRRRECEKIGRNCLEQYKQQH